MSRRKRRAGYVRNGQAIETSIPIQGLEGEVNVSSVAAVSLLGVDHLLRYSSRLGAERLTFRFKSDLARTYVAPSSSVDVISPSGRTWTHNGSTQTGSLKLREGSASVVLNGANTDSSGATVHYSVSAEHPFSEKYEGELNVPFS